MGLKFQAKLGITLNALLFCEDLYVIKCSALSYQGADLFVLKLTHVTEVINSRI